MLQTVVAAGSTGVAEEIRFLKITQSSLLFGLKIYSSRLVMIEAWKDTQ